MLPLPFSPLHPVGGGTSPPGGGGGEARLRGTRTRGHNNRPLASVLPNPPPPMGSLQERPAVNPAVSPLLSNCNSPGKEGPKAGGSWGGGGEVGGGVLRVTEIPATHSSSKFGPGALTDPRTGSGCHPHPQPQESQLWSLFLPTWNCKFSKPSLGGGKRRQGSRKLLSGPGFPPRFPLVEPAETSLCPSGRAKVVLGRKLKPGLCWVDRKVLGQGQEPPSSLRP